VFQADVERGNQFMKGHDQVGAARRHRKLLYLGDWRRALFQTSPHCSQRQ